MHMQSIVFADSAVELGCLVVHIAAYSKRVLIGIRDQFAPYYFLFLL